MTRIQFPRFRVSGGVLIFVACVLLFTGAMLTFFTDSRWIAATLDLSASALLLIWALRALREIKVAQAQLEGIQRELDSRLNPPE